MKTDELAHYLSTMGEGGAFDSHGVFTVDLEKSAYRLQHHLLENPEDYLLLLVRAANAGGAERLELSLSYKKVHLEWRLSDDALSRFVEGLLKRDEQPDRASQLLLLAVGGAFDQEASLVVIEWPEGRLTSDGQTLRVESREGAEGVLSLTFHRSGGFLSLRRRAAAEHQAVSRRCAFSSTIIYLDGRLITPGQVVPVKRSRRNSGLPDGLVLVEAFLRYGSDKLERMPCPAPIALYRYEGSLSDSAETWEPSPGAVFLRIIEKDCGAYFQLSSLHGKGQLQVVKDGVCLEALESDLWLRGSLMVVRAEAVETDLSGLRARGSEELQGLLDWTTEQNRALADVLGKSLFGLKGHSFPSGGKLVAGLAAGGMGLMWGFIGGPLCAATMFGVSAAIGAALHKPTESPLQAHIRTYLDRESER